MTPATKPDVSAIVDVQIEINKSVLRHRVQMLSGEVYLALQPAGDFKDNVVQDLASLRNQVRSRGRGYSEEYKCIIKSIECECAVSLT